MSILVISIRLNDTAILLGMQRVLHFCLIQGELLSGGLNKNKGIACGT